MARRPSTRANALLLAVVATLLAVDLVLDVQARDAFTWMDPSQYFGFATGVLDGTRAPREFGLPTVYPFLLLPALAIAPTIPAALVTELGWMALGMLALGLLRRQHGIRTPLWLLSLVVFGAPVIIGLSRSLYVELALTAWVALTYWLWRRALDSGATRDAIALGAAVAAGISLKIVFPVHLALPIAAGLVRTARGRTRPRRALEPDAGDPDRPPGSRRRAVLLLGALAGGGAIAAGIAAALFPRALEYVLTVGNTAIPIMRLVGPHDVLSLDSITYYLRDVVRSQLLVLSPLVVVAVVVTWRRARTDQRTLDLWLWALGPLLILIAQPVKEPRYVAPSIVPLALLIGLALDRVRGTVGVVASRAALAVIAVAQYVLVTGHVVEAPYFLDRPLRVEMVREALLRRAASDPRYAATPPEGLPTHWAMNQNVVLDGFRPNEAVAIMWQLRPAAIVDLACLDPADWPGIDAGYETFEDFFLLSWFNSYNRRTGWRRYVRTISRADAIALADVVIVRSEDAHEVGSAYAHLVPVTRLETVPGESIAVFAAPTPSATSYRALYAHRFVERHSSRPEPERNAIGRELAFVAVMRADRDAYARAMAEFPGAFGAVRNIYWLRVYEPLHRLLVPRLRAAMSRAG